MSQVIEVIDVTVVETATRNPRNEVTAETVNERKAKNPNTNRRNKKFITFNESLSQQSPAKPSTAQHSLHIVNVLSSVCLKLTLSSIVHNVHETFHAARSHVVTPKVASFHFQLYSQLPADMKKA